ncbi:multicopper oxidase family protein [Salinarimonas sp.]|uniref:multicopper oxidase family protein n=1 Tax=Salinarimonas sp. TaxID=2766526 RepID=UPI0032D91454
MTFGTFPAPLTRRSFLVRTAACAGALALPAGRARAAATRELTLTPAPAKAALVGPPYPETAVWAYDGRVPGPELRVAQGDRLRIEVDNHLPAPTTIHWHGLRLPNAMDGVAHVTQPPIAPGERFVYAFDAPDAGTFWYHPHYASAEQLERGLSGVLVVEEPEPIRVDRDLVWALDDWRLDRDAAIVEDFGSGMDMSHAGRLGNTVTLNGRIPDAVAVSTGERLRLRLVNVANARIFALRFENHTPTVVARDGHPVTPHEPAEGIVLLGPGMRVDLVLDCGADPGARASVVDVFPRDPYRLLDLAYGETPLRESPLDASLVLAPNPVPEPDLAAAPTHEIVFEGGMMGGFRGGREMMRAMTSRGLAWAVNGVADDGGHTISPLLTVESGRSIVLDLANETAWWHPIHLHGHAFRILERDGAPEPHTPLADTALMAPRERMRIAFVAEGAGDWLLHCHVLEHQVGGMSAIVRVV